jgi:hypothetical protein
MPEHPTPDGLPLFDLTSVIESVSRILEVNPEDVRELAGTTRSTAEDLLSDSEFRSLQLENGMLGGFGKGADVVAAHQTAHKVVLDTLNGVHEDLMAFATYLDKSIEGLGDADDLSASALDQLAQIQYGEAGDQARVDAQENYVPPENNAGGDSGGDSGDDA